MRDTGRGIDASLLSSIFGMFVQGKDAYTQPASGLGVGLALARSIVELHHGTLEAKSEGIGKGSEFVVTLPAISPAADGASAPKREFPTQQSGKTVAPSRRRVLVVDDNADAAGALASLLRSYGHDVAESHDGKDALQVAEDFRPEVVLLDIGMPDMSGFEVARRLRERNASPRPLIVAITGWGKQEDQVRSRDAGFDLHLVKPVEEKPLMRVMETATLNASSRERVE